MKWTFFYESVKLGEDQKYHIEGTYEFEGLNRSYHDVLERQVDVAARFRDFRYEFKQELRSPEKAPF